MAKLVSAGAKNLAMDLLTNTDSVDSSGNPTKRTSFPKKYLRSANYIRKKIFSQIQINYTKKSDDESVVSNSCLFDEFQKIKSEGGVNVVSETHTETEIDLDEKDVLALKYFYNERSELPIVSNETLDEFEAILNLKKV